MNPVPLPPNVSDHFYLCGERIAELRGLPPGDAPARRPEEWLGSTVTRWGSDRSGVTDLGPAGVLPDLIAAGQEAWLGNVHAARWGSSPALLVKLLDAGQRLPVHAHPTRGFASRHLNCPFGKSEAWAVIDTPAGGGTVFVGAHRPVSGDEWARLVTDQDTTAMLELLNPLTVHAGDGVFVPAGTPHAIDDGLIVVEVQEPTDFSILLEWRGFDIDGTEGAHLGLGFDVALDAVRRDVFDAAMVDRLVRRAGEGSLRSILPDLADPYFRAWSVRTAAGPVTVPASFAVIVVLDGDGTLACTGDRRPIRRGDAFVVPYAAGELTFDGTLSAIVAQPPDPSAADPIEWDVGDD
ncbi:class I mannose-6-phosphate isomerase [soil metagenome]